MVDNYSYFGIIGSGETYPLTLYERKTNSNYEYEDIPVLTFKGRPANNKEVRTFRLQQGVNGNDSSVYVFCSQLPKELKPQDRVFFMGKFWTVESIGFYYDNSRIINAEIMSCEYLESICPKGLTLV